MLLSQPQCHCNFVYHGKAGSVPQFEKKSNFAGDLLGNADKVADFLQYEDYGDMFNTDNLSDITQCLNVDFSLE